MAYAGNLKSFLRTWQRLAPKRTTAKFSVFAAGSPDSLTLRRPPKRTRSQTQPTPLPTPARELAWQLQSLRRNSKERDLADKGSLSHPLAGTCDHRARVGVSVFDRGKRNPRLEREKFRPLIFL